MGAKLDLTGQKPYMLTAIEDTGKRDKSGNAIWKCECECGRVCFVSASAFQRGDTKSCGCLRVERFKEIITKHGRSRTPSYKDWLLMMDRCYNENNAQYKNYGGRGIKVCPEWHDTETFCEWADSHGCKKDLQLDRRDNNGDYSPENCHYVTPKQNMRNRRITLRLPSGESILDFCERWLGREIQSRSAEGSRIYYHWRNYKRLPDFVFIAMRDRAIADLDAEHKRSENEQH